MKTSRESVVYGADERLADAGWNPSATTVKVPLSKALKYHLRGQKRRTRLAAPLRLFTANERLLLFGEQPVATAQLSSRLSLTTYHSSLSISGLVFSLNST